MSRQSLTGQWPPSCAVGPPFCEIPVRANTLTGHQNQLAATGGFAGTSTPPSWCRKPCKRFRRFRCGLHWLVARERRSRNFELTQVPVRSWNVVERWTFENIQNDENVDMFQFMEHIQIEWKYFHFLGQKFGGWWR